MLCRSDREASLSQGPQDPSLMCISHGAVEMEAETFHIHVSALILTGADGADAHIVSLSQCRCPPAAGPEAWPLYCV